MQAAMAARIFHDWAVTEGLSRDGPVAPVTSSLDEMNLLAVSADMSKQILRHRGVQGIIFNETEKEIVVLTKLAKPTKKQIAQLPMEIDDISISYRQGSPSTIGGLPPRPFGTPPYVVRQVGGMDRYACGSSISQGNGRDAGTLGCLVRRNGQDNPIYGLSNNHVTGGCSHASVGLPILAPGVIDVMPVSEDPFTIGYHEQALDMMLGTPENTNAANNIDAAIFKLKDNARVSSYQGTVYDTPANAVAVLSSMNVEKVGRTTGHTKGVVIGQYHGGVPIHYDMEMHEFKGRVFFDPVFLVKGIGGSFSEPGDSGALVVALDANGQRSAIGLVVGGIVDRGSPGGTLTIMLPIIPILTKLGVALVSGHNV